MRYIPHTEEDVQRMLEAIGVEKLDDLFESIPAHLILDRPLQLPDALDEQSLLRRVRALASANTGSGDRMATFLGAGAYAHHLPSAVDNLLLRSEFFTAYTPYQAEVSQGTLQAIFEYQSMMAELIGTEVVNASMYDGASATAEALLMAQRIKRKRPRNLLSAGLHPEVVATCRTYLSDHAQAPEQLALGPDGTTDLTALQQRLDDGVAAVVVQQPNLFGCIEPLQEIVDRVHAASALLIAVVLEPTSLGLLAAPGSQGADIVTGEGMSFGSGLNFGGPGLGIFGTTAKNAWQMPGRLVGQTVDSRGQTGYVLTMSTREQHIRRSRATSNICTNEGLCSLAAAIHLSLLGKKGLRDLAYTNAANARALQRALLAVKGVEPVFNAPTYNEFVYRFAGGSERALEALAAEGILGGVDLNRLIPDKDALKDCIVTCATEVNTAEQVQRYAATLAGLKG